MPSKTVAVTGGIGSGKTEVINIIKSFGYKVYNLDEIYRELLKNYEFLQEVCGILKVFPILNSDGSYTFDHRKAGENAFSDEKIKTELNAFTHPRIMAKFKELISAENGLVFCEVPLLFESGLKGEFDKVIVVTRDLRIRIEAVKTRDDLTEEEIIKRIKNQFDYANFIPDEHTIVIENDCGKEVLYEKVKSVIEKIC